MARKRAVGTIAYQCEYCDKMFPRKAQAVVHEMKVHGICPRCKAPAMTIYGRCDICDT